jgi:hypothetical protein
MAKGIVIGGVSIPSGAKVKSIQRGTWAFSATQLSSTVNITAVDLTKSIIMINGTSTNGYPSNSPGLAMVSGGFNSATQLAFTRGIHNNIPVNFVWTVVEYESGVKIQSGTIAASALATINTTINTIVLNKTMLFFSYLTEQGSSNTEYLFFIGTFTSTTNLRFERNLGDTYSKATITYYIVEFT